MLQFCWLQPEQRPTAEEVHLLLSYLCAKGTTELEEEFERRWRSLRPGGSASLGAGPAGPAAAPADLTAASSFPLLEQFTSDGFHVDSDDVLTVTETSRGLNFEYKWEAGCGAEAFPPMGGTSSPGSPACLQELCAPDGSPPGVVPVLSAHSPSVGSEYFIRLEGAEPAAGHDPDCSGCAPSPQAVPDQDDNSEDSTAASLVMEPLLGHAPPAGGLWGPCDHHSRKRREPPCPSRSPSPGTPMLPSEDIDWGVATFCPPFFDDPLGASPSGSPGAQLSPGDEGLEEGRAGRAARCGHWSSNMSANNNSGSRDPESWDPGYVSSFTDSYRDDCSSLEQTPRASPELGFALSQEDPRECLPGLVAASPSQEPSRCLSLPPLRPAKGLAPAACFITSSWTEVAVGGGHNPHVEPKLAQEAEGSAEPQLPLPSVPSPSHEGASLPSEEASAPDVLPASPTPAAGSRVTFPKPAPSLDSSSSPLGHEAPSSEDEDTTEEVTSGVFTDLSSDGPHPEKPGTVPALRCLQQQVGTPDSLDSLDIPSSASDGGCEVLSASAAGPPGGQPRAVDSGYDTENYESPEFVLKEAHEASDPEAFGELASEGEGPGPETLVSASLGGLSKKNPYRDSAYFSDLDAESEPTFRPEKLSGVQDSPKEQDLESSPSPGHQSGQAFSRPDVPREVLPLPQQAEEALADSPRPDPLGAQRPAEVQPVPSPARSECFLLTSVPPSSEGNGLDPEGPPGQLSGSAQRARAGGPSTPRSPLCLALPGRPGATEDEEDSEDSDESDEELRCYSVREPSEDSEEEPPAVPVVVAESQSARNLRSLLKMPSLLSEAFCEDLERKKKAVSFFDDVTVYLFDQVGCRRGRAQGRGGVGSPSHVVLCPRRRAPPERLGSPSPAPRSLSPRSRRVAPAHPGPPACRGGLPCRTAPLLNRVSQVLGARRDSPCGRAGRKRAAGRSGRGVTEGTCGPGLQAARSDGTPISRWYLARLPWWRRRRWTRPTLPWPRPPRQRRPSRVSRCHPRLPPASPSPTYPTQMPSRWEVGAEGLRWSREAL